MATFFSEIQHTYAPNSGDGVKEDINVATFLAATRESLALLGTVILLGRLNPLSWADRWADQVSLLKGWSAIGWSTEMADLSNADHVVVTDAVTRPAYNWLIYMYMAYLLSKIADLLVTNLAGWSAKWSADKNDVNLADPQLADLSNGSSPPPQTTSQPLQTRTMHRIIIAHYVPLPGS